MTEPAPWPLLRELGPEFLEVAVRAQVAWHGPTAAWAIALDLGVSETEVGRSLTRLIKAGDVRAVLLGVPDLADYQPFEHDDVPDALPGLFSPVSVVPQGRFELANATTGTVDLWAFALGWLAARAFTDRYVVTCPGCAGDGYTERSWLGTDAELEAAESSQAAVRAVVYDGDGEQYRIDYEPLVPGELWRITARTWCSSCYGDDEGELGQIELTIAELIGHARSGGSRADGGVRDHLAVLADKLEFEGDPWGLWIAALLSGSVVARQEHEAALARTVRTVGPAPGSGPPPSTRPTPSGLGALGATMRALGVGAAAAAAGVGELNRAMAEVGASFERQGVFDELRRTIAEIGGILEKPPPGLEAADPLPREHRFGPVGDRLRRRLDRGRRNRTVGQKR